MVPQIATCLVESARNSARRLALKDLFSDFQGQVFKFTCTHNLGTNLHAECRARSGQGPSQQAAQGFYEPVLGEAFVGNVVGHAPGRLLLPSCIVVDVFDADGRARRAMRAKRSARRLGGGCHLGGQEPSKESEGPEAPPFLYSLVSSDSPALVALREANVGRNHSSFKTSATEWVSFWPPPSQFRLVWRWDPQSL